MQKAKQYPTWLEFIPLVLFFILNKYFNLYIATAALMITGCINVFLGYFISKQINYTSVISMVLVLIFGGLTLILHNEQFIKIKVTILNIVIALLLFVGVIIKKPFLKLIFKDHINLTNKGWVILNYIWILFFIILAILNEIIWRNFDTKTWVSFKVFGILILTIIFTILIMPIIKRYSNKL